MAQKCLFIGGGSSQPGSTLFSSRKRKAGSELLTHFVGNAFFTKISYTFLLCPVGGEGYSSCFFPWQGKRLRESQSLGTSARAEVTPSVL